MSWEERLLAVFDDLEQQAEGLALLERDAQVNELSHAAYRVVDLGARLHASPGRALTLGVLGVGNLAGRVVRVGADFVVLEAAEHTWVVRCAALTWVRGLSDQAIGTDARTLPSKVGLGSVLRGFAEATVPLSVHISDGSVAQGRVRRVGADFVELWRSEATETSGRLDSELVPFPAIAGLRASVHA